MKKRLIIILLIVLNASFLNAGAGKIHSQQNSVSAVQQITLSPALGMVMKPPRSADNHFYAGVIFLLMMGTAYGVTKNMKMKPKQGMAGKTF